MDPSVISEFDAQEWVSKIRKLLNRQLEIEVEIPPVSVFQVPETITKNKPEAYTPQQIGLGPYHHFQPEPYTKMEQKKLVAVQKILQYHDDIKDFDIIVLNVQKLVPVIRACYEMFLEHDNVWMAWVFAIDGLFLLNIFETYSSNHPKAADPTTKRLLAQDIMMVENQIPFMVLKEISYALQSSPGTSFSASVFRSFCEIHSPLELCSTIQAPTCAEHLLHYMYSSIINNVPKEEALPLPVSSVDSSVLPISSIDSSVHSSVLPVSREQISSIGYSYVSASIDSSAPAYALLKSTVELYEQTISSLQNFCRNNVIIPSASELKYAGGFNFHGLQKDEGIQNIKIEGNNMYLPCVSLNKDSEVILRNLIAYETLIPNSNHFPLTEYMGLMCGLVENVDDVKLLRKENIIKGDLSDDEVAKIFLEMSTCILSLKTKQKSKMQEMIDKFVNKGYVSSIRIRANLFLKKLANWLLVILRLIGSFAEATWKIGIVMISIVSLFMLTYQAFCDVYGCHKNNVTLQFNMATPS